ncbi:MAG: hypothetical protein ACLRVU_03375 [Beduini sp.]|uniref:hypothetical protein n=1 Tax=Beduini sp. TaxID=1922300 RepID=UPI00399EEC3C
MNNKSLNTLPKDILGNTEELKLVVADKMLEKHGIIQNVMNTKISFNFNAADEIYADIYKELDGISCRQWDQLTSLKTIYIPEPAGYYEAKISLDENDSTIKHLSGISLCEAELSQINLYNIEINTKNDILREEYTIPTTFYNEEYPKASLLNRLMEKIPHYSIGYVALSLRKVQKTFTFDNISIYDALMEIADETECLFQFDSLNRTINVYDLLYYCKHCGHREDQMKICSKCGNEQIMEPYGEETSIFISTDNIAESISLEDNADQIKNCFRLKAGDELMSATIRNLNPNGSDYIYYFSDDMKQGMPKALVDKLQDYDVLYNCYLNEYQIHCDNDPLKESFNALVKKYNHHSYASYKYDDDNNKVLTDNAFVEIDDAQVGYAYLTSLNYSIIDFKYYLESGLLPTVLDDEKTAQKELEKVLLKEISPIGLSKVSASTSQQTAESAIKNYIQFILSQGYTATLQTESFDYLGQNNSGIYECRWSGKIHIYKYSDKEDSFLSDTLTIIINNEYEIYLKQKIEKELSDDEEHGSIYDLINIPYSDSESQFKTALCYYSKNRLLSFSDAYEAALNILADLGQGQYGASFYESFYVPYFNRKNLIKKEYDLRVDELKRCTDTLSMIEKIKSDIAEVLDLKLFLGHSLWTLFNTYRREDTYENQNYVSATLNNSQMIAKAEEFIKIASQELMKSSTHHINITGQFKDFLSIEQFRNHVEQLQLGCWIHLSIDDYVYKVRLISCEKALNSQDNIPLIFSSTTKTNHLLSDIENILNSAKSMSTNYSYTTHQASQGAEGNAVVQDWLKEGLDLTKLKIFNDKKRKVTTDKNGLTLRAYDDIEDVYEPEQMKLTETSILLTDDDWETVKTAIGKYWYIDPLTNEKKATYGINAETLIGRLIIGETLKLSSKSGTMIFDENGLTLNSTNKDGKYQKVFTIQKDGNNIVFIDNNGALNLKDIIASGLINGSTIKGSTISGGMISGSTINGNTITNGSNFTVDTMGKMKSINGDFQGKITAKSGMIGGLDVSANALSYVVENTSYDDPEVTGKVYGNFNLYMKKTGATDKFFGWKFTAKNDPKFSDGTVLVDTGFSSFGMTGVKTISAKSISLMGLTSAISSLGQATCSSLIVNGTKSRIVQTQNFSTRLLNAVESPDPIFEDSGIGYIAANGECIIYIDPIFRETINSKNQYYIQLTKCGLGDIYAKKMYPDYFIVGGTSNLKFFWNIKAKQLGYENNRLVKDSTKVSDTVTKLNKDTIQEIYNKENSFVGEVSNFFTSYLQRLENYYE